LESRKKISPDHLSMRILQIKQPREIQHILQDIRVDPYGIKIMLPKAITHLVKIDSVSNITANILKQEMLSLGGDAAVAKGALTGIAKKTDCLLIGNLSQFKRLEEKLKTQPFGLGLLAKDLNSTIKSYEREDFILRAGAHKLCLGGRTLVMGIVNITPDSFSDDGLLSSKLKPTQFIEFAKELCRDGADIIDVGGESSRPGAKPVPVKEELKRVIPFIKIAAKKIRVPISIDTTKPEVAKQALDNVAAIVNDISGLRDPRMARILARYKAAAVVMHMKGNPRTMQNNPRYASLMDEIIRFLNNSIETAVQAGVDRESLIVDPGIGFGKTPEDNLTILKELSELKSLGRPILVGTSRKSFIGKILKNLPRERIFGTVSSCVIAADRGAHIVRTHDVKEVKQALKIMEAVKKA